MDVFYALNWPKIVCRQDSAQTRRAAYIAPQIPYLDDGRREGIGEIAGQEGERREGGRKGREKEDSGRNW